MRKRSFVGSDFAMVDRRPLNLPVQGALPLALGSVVHNMLEKAMVYGVAVTGQVVELRRFRSYIDDLVHHEVAELGLPDSWLCGVVRAYDDRTVDFLLTDVVDTTPLTCLECITKHSPPRSKSDVR